MEKTTTTKEKTRRNNRFEEEKESRLLMQYHRFLSIEDKNWGLLREKLIHLRQIYGWKQALQLCPICLSLFLSNSLKKHAQISIGSLFLRFDPAEHTSKEVAQLFQEHGRIKTKKNGDVLVGFPSFNQVCIQDHSSLEGSTIQFHSSCNEEKTKVNEAIQRDTSSLKKRPPRTEIKQQIKGRSIQNEQKNKLWKPTLKAVIPPLPIYNADDLNASPSKQNNATK